MGTLGLGLGDFRFGTWALGGEVEGQSFNHSYQRLGFYGALGLGLGDFRFGTGALGGQAEGQSFNHPYQRLGFYGALALGLGDFRFGTGALGGQGEGQSFRTRLGLGEGQNTVSGLGGSRWRLGGFNRFGFGLHVSTGPQPAAIFLFKHESASELHASSCHELSALLKCCCTAAQPANTLNYGNANFLLSNAKHLAFFDPLMKRPPV